MSNHQQESSFITEITKAAAEIASSFGHIHIGSGHLLCAILKDKSTDAAHILVSHGVTLRAVQSIIEDEAGVHDWSAELEFQDGTPRTKKMLTGAEHDASMRNMPLNNVFILKAMIGDSGCYGTRIIYQLIEADIGKLRQDCDEYLSA